MKKFTQIYSIDKEKLTKTEMLEEIGADRAKVEKAPNPRSVVKWIPRRRLPGR